jgi:hypothetical protein
LSERYRAYEDERRQRNKEELWEMILQAVRARHASQLPISFTAIGSDIGHSLWGPTAREGYLRARREVGLDR